MSRNVNPSPLGQVKYFIYLHWQGYNSFKLQSCQRDPRHFPQNVCSIILLAAAWRCYNVEYPEETCI